MRNSGLKGSFPLERITSDARVVAVSPRIFPLYRWADGWKFTIRRVGRSDADVNRRLHAYVGRYSHFKFDYSPSSSTAFEKECSLFHRLNPQDNRSPHSTSWHPVEMSHVRDIRLTERYA